MNRRHFAITITTLTATILTGYRVLASSRQKMKRINDTLYDILDTNTGEYFTYSKVTTYADGSVMTDGQCDGVIYRKLGDEYFKRNFSGPVNVKWFGAKGDGLTVDTDAIRKAISVSLSIYIPAGTYLLDNTATSGDFFLYLGTQGSGGNPISRNGINISGDGNSTILKLANNVGPSKLLFGGAIGDTFSKMTFRDFVIDLNGQNNLQENFEDPLRYNSAFYFFCYCEEILFDNLTIKNISGHQAIRIGGDAANVYGNKIKVINCRFENFGIGLLGNKQQDVSVVYVQADNIVVENNSWTNANFDFDLSRGHTGCELHGVSSTKVLNNTYNYVQMPILIVSSSKANSNVLVQSNTFNECNYMVGVDSAEYDQKGITITNNQYRSTKVNSKVLAIGVSEESAKNREDISFLNNTLTGWGNPNQGTHIFHIESIYMRSLKIEGNTIGGFNGSLLYLAGEVRNDGYATINIKNNTLDSLGATGGPYPNSPAFVHVETTGGIVSVLNISNNILYNSALKNYGDFGAFKVFGAINHVFIDDNKTNALAEYPIVTENISNNSVRSIESSRYRPVSYQSPIFAVPSSGSVKICDLANFGNNDHASLRISIWVGIGGTALNAGFVYELVHTSSASTCTLLSKIGTFKDDITLSIAVGELNIHSTYGGALSAYLTIDGRSTKAIAFLV